MTQRYKLGVLTREEEHRNVQKKGAKEACLNSDKQLREGVKLFQTTGSLKEGAGNVNKGVSGTKDINNKREDVSAARRNFSFGQASDQQSEIERRVEKKRVSGEGLQIPGFVPNGWISTPAERDNSKSTGLHSQGSKT